MNAQNILAASPFFGSLSPEQLERLSGLALLKKAAKGTLIFTEGEKADKLHLIGQGRVKVFRASPDGREVILHVLGPGEAFGEVVVFQGKAYPASALALDDCLLVALPRPSLVGALREDPDLALAMLAGLSRRLREFVNKVEALALMEAPQRLAAYLLHMSELNPNADGFTLDVSKSLLAGMLGAARETLSRCLTRMAENNLISMEGRRVTVLNPKALEALAKGLAVL